jgi:hypothetical protein
MIERSNDRTIERTNERTNERKQFKKTSFVKLKHSPPHARDYRLLE